MGGSVLVLGSACADVVIRVARLPRRAEDLQPLGQRIFLGGCARNAAHVLGVNGAEVTFVTPIGLRGAFGPFVRSALQSCPWARPVLLEQEENGCCYCLVEPDGERTFLSVRGAEYRFDPAWMRPWAGRTFDLGYACGLEAAGPDGDALVSWLAGGGVCRLLFAPGPGLEEIPAALLRRLLSLRPMLHLNRAEALRMSGTADLPEAAARLLARCGSAVIITLGREGAAVADGDGLRIIPPCPVERVVNTTGAGDAHAGALLLGLSRALSLEKAAALANQAAARVVMSEAPAVDEPLP